MNAVSGLQLHIKLCEVSSVLYSGVLMKGSSIKLKGYDNIG